MPSPYAELAVQLAAKLQAGLNWPGDPARKLPPKTLLLPLRPGAGMPKEMGQLLNETAKQLAEAMIHFVTAESGKKLVDVGEMERLSTMETRTSGGKQFARPVPLHCICDRQLADPLVYLTITDDHRIVVDARQLILGLEKREAAHPHKVIG
jgi:hypothetical protein